MSLQSDIVCNQGICVSTNPEVFVSDKPPAFRPADGSIDINSIVLSPNELVESFIVKFIPEFNPASFLWPVGIIVKYNYTPLYNGVNILAKLSIISKIVQQNPIISSFYRDQTFTTQANTPAAFIYRVGANNSSQKSGDGFGSLANRTDINIFIVDTGIAFHSDLNIVGGVNYTTQFIGQFLDGNGHGTHVAGIAAALDNDIGKVGVAPGARLWAVKVLDDTGNGSASNIIAGLNWILTNRGIKWSGTPVVNMSIGGPIYQPLDDAVANLIANGIPTVVAAGNEAQAASNSTPGRVATAITVGASSPFWAYTELASFSNYGSSVTITAPGTDILSTWLGNGYAYNSGTSMSAPVVAGTIALLYSTVTIAGGNTGTFSLNVKNRIINDSSDLTPIYFDGSIGSNPRITIPPGVPATTNINVWAGAY